LPAFARSLFHSASLPNQLFTIQRITEREYKYNPRIDVIAAALTTLRSAVVLQNEKEGF
jgi:hypothetical protein